MMKYPLLLGLILLVTLLACSTGPENAKDKDQKDTTDTAQTAVLYGKGRTAQKQLPPRQKLAHLELAALSTAHQVHYPDAAPMTMRHSENYQLPDESGVHLAAVNPLSTFSVDVDTASYSNVRRLLNMGQLPPAKAVRIEEFINYFDYGYPSPQSVDTPFNVSTKVTTSPYKAGRHLLKIGLQGYQPDDIPPSNLVFLIDVSGSMKTAKKLPLLKRSLSLLVEQLNDKDSVSIVVYAGASGVVLEPTPGNKKHQIIAALDNLYAGGATHGEAGIKLAYQLAQQAFIPNGNNRVILATDGDFNVGQTDHDALMSLIKRKRKSMIGLSVLGFGSGNYNDHLMEQLANNGNGNAAYIDSIHEAQKVLVDERLSTLLTIAKDVKVQVEFNPSRVKEYRLIGYDNRLLDSEDFNNDKVDAGEIGAGHSVTAIYELVLTDSHASYISPLKYSDAAKESDSTELATVSIRYKKPDQNTSRLVEFAVGRADITPFSKIDENTQFAIAVSGFAALLRESDFVEGVDEQTLLELAVSGKGEDRFGYRAEFAKLIRTYYALHPSIY